MSASQFQCFKTRLFPTFTRSDPWSFAFYVAPPARSILLSKFYFDKDVKCLDTTPFSFPDFRISDHFLRAFELWNDLANL